MRVRLSCGGDPRAVCVCVGGAVLFDWLDGCPSVCMEVEIVVEPDRASVVATEGASVVDPRVSPGVMARLLVEQIGRASCRERV